MNNISYIIGVVAVVALVLGYFGLRRRPRSDPGPRDSPDWRVADADPSA